jgi:hypothetical protein
MTSAAGGGLIMRTSTRKRHHVVQLLKVQHFNVSKDGFGVGGNQSLDRPFGDADPASMFAWAGTTASWPNRTEPGGKPWPR